MSNQNPQNTAETVELVKAAQADTIEKAGVVAGSGTTAGWQNWNLEPAAKNLFPVTTTLRNRIARVGNGNGGVGATYKYLTSFNNPGEAGVIEGGRAVVQGGSPLDRTAFFRTLGVEGSVTYEAQSATRGFDDVLANETTKALLSLMEQEEKAIVGGRTTVALAAITGLTATAADGGSIPAGTYVVKAVALTNKGAANSSVASGVATQRSLVAADGTSFTSKGYHGAVATAAAVTVTANQKLSVSCNGVAGAAAYAWYVGTAGAEKLCAITSVSFTEISTLNGSGQAATALNSAENGKDELAFDGLLTLSFDSSPYNKVFGIGNTGLNGSGGHLSDIDDVLQAMYDGHRISPDKMLVSSDLAAAVNKKILDGANIRLAQQAASIDGGSYVTTYINPVTGKSMTVEVHPFLPKGSILLYTTSLDYPMPNIENLIQIKTNREYNQISWPLRRRTYEFGVYVEEVLQHYLPASMAVLSNIKA
ncbi:hypothetical protein [Flavobacterium sp.]|jgi:hypothetical protein|uniref:SU10 major capsid protein n=1 Tax=Flavobacterium sp. TaxID=239 RepID=UPI0037C14F9C